MLRETAPMTLPVSLMMRSAIYSHAWTSPSFIQDSEEDRLDKEEEDSMHAVHPHLPRPLATSDPLYALSRRDSKCLAHHYDEWNALTSTTSRRGRVSAR